MDVKDLLPLIMQLQFICCIIIIIHPDTYQGVEQSCVTPFPSPVLDEPVILSIDGCPIAH